MFDFVFVVLDRTVFDDWFVIDDGEVIATVRELVYKEGIFVGILVGGMFVGVLWVVCVAPAGSVILAMLSDTGERYLSTVLFEGVNQGFDPV